MKAGHGRSRKACYCQSENDDCKMEGHTEQERENFSRIGLLLNSDIKNGETLDDSQT